MRIWLQKQSNSPTDVPNSKVIVIIQAAEKLRHYIIHRRVFLTWTCALLYVGI